MISVNSYLDRINYKGSQEPTLETLIKLHRRHLLSVPFENLDVHYNTPIHLEIDKLFEKIVTNQRGGFCYELNGMFSALLKELGYDIRLVSANVYEGEEKGFSPDFDHLAILVNIEGNRWLADVGFGDFIREPLNLDSRAAQVDSDNTYRIRKQDCQNLYLVEHKTDSFDWKPEYRFTAEGYELADFKERCHFHQTSSESHVPKKKVCSIATRNGRITLTGDKLKITKDGSVEEKPVLTEQDFRKLLSRYFDISCKYRLNKLNKLFNLVHRSLGIKFIK